MERAITRRREFFNVVFNQVTRVIIITTNTGADEAAFTSTQISIQNKEDNLMQLRTFILESIRNILRIFPVT